MCQRLMGFCGDALKDGDARSAHKENGHVAFNLAQLADQLRERPSHQDGDGDAGPHTPRKRGHIAPELRQLHGKMNTELNGVPSGANEDDKQGSG
ncbi:hypothetical protein FA95DRAFT_1600306, partial [Auriscalpium vulgare]